MSNADAGTSHSTTEIARATACVSPENTRSARSMLCCEREVMTSNDGTLELTYPPTEHQQFDIQEILFSPTTIHTHIAPCGATRAHLPRGK